MIQGSEEWLKIRKGRATASEASKILTPTGKPSAQSISYMRKLARETFMDDPLEWTGNKHTDWGNEQEPHARAAFTARTGLEVIEVGFCQRFDRAPIGCSPDGLVLASDGIITAGLEIKCPQVDTHVKYVMEGVLPDTYKLQLHWSMAVTGLKIWHFMSYFPELVPLILTVQWDSFTDKVLAAQDDFVRAYAAELTAVRAKLLPQHPTDSII
jgi:putative phage-type endonuclease